MGALLSATVLDNTLHDWALAAVWLLAVFTVLTGIKPRVLAWLAARAARTSASWGAAAVLALDATRTWMLCLAALGPLAESLEMPAAVARWITGLASAALLAQMGLWLGRFLDHWIKRSRDRAVQQDPATITGLAATSFLARVALWAVLVVLLLGNLGFNVTTLLAGLGVGGVAVGLALQNILGDLFSSLSILLDKPFQIGHFVVVDDFSGTVENIGLKTTRIRSLGGELLVFSNTDLTKARLRNYQFMQERRIVFGFGLTHRTPPDRLAEIPALVRDIVEAQPRTRFDRAHLKTIGESALGFEVVYWMTTADYGAYMDTQQAINLALLRACAARDVGFAFPTRTVMLGAGAELPVVVRSRADRSPDADGR